MSDYNLETKCIHSGYTPSKGEPVHFLSIRAPLTNMTPPTKWASYLI